MMLKKLLYLFAIIGAVFSSCSKNGKTSDKIQEPEQVYLESTEFINDSLLAKPRSLAVANEAIIVSNSASIDSSWISIFNLKGEFVRSCVHQGQGPMEMLGVSNIQYSAPGHCVYVVDLQLFDYKIFSVSDYMAQNVTLTDVFSFSAVNNDSIMLSGGAVCLSNGEIVAGNANAAGMIAIFDKKSDSIRLFGHVPDKSLIDSRLSDFGNASIYHPQIAVSPKGDFAAFYYLESDMHLLINVVDNKTEIDYVEGAPATGISPTEVAPGIFVGAQTGKTFNYTMDLYASNNYLYELYIGLTSEELRNTDYFKDAQFYGANTVRVYDRSGKHVKTITLDRWACALAVSADDKYLYTLTLSSEEGYTILRYEL